jgi:hypothetical protein
VEIDRLINRTIFKSLFAAQEKVEKDKSAHTENFRSLECMVYFSIFGFALVPISHLQANLLIQTGWLPVQFSFWSSLTSLRVVVVVVADRLVHRRPAPEPCRARARVVEKRRSS